MVIEKIKAKHPGVPIIMYINKVRGNRCKGGSSRKETTTEEEEDEEEEEEEEEKGLTRAMH